MSTSPGPGPRTIRAATSREPGRGRRLASMAVVSTLAAFLVPLGYLALYGFTSESALVAAAETAFVHADLSDSVGNSAKLAQLTATWRGFHLVKAVAAALLVVNLAYLASTVRLRADDCEPGRHRGWLVAINAGVVVWLLGALTVLVANVQGAVAPLASVTSLLPPGRAAGALGGVLGRLRDAVAIEGAASAGGVASELLADFTLYHAIVAVVAAVTGCALATAAARATRGRWRRRGPVRVSQPTWLVRAAGYGIAAAFFLVLAVANTSTWIHPVPALVASLAGR